MTIEYRPVRRSPTIVFSLQRKTIDNPWPRARYEKAQKGINHGVSVCTRTYLPSRGIGVMQPTFLSIRREPCSIVHVSYADSLDQAGCIIHLSRVCVYGQLPIIDNCERIGQPMTINDFIRMNEKEGCALR